MKLLIFLICACALVVMITLRYQIKENEEDPDYKIVVTIGFMIGSILGSVITLIAKLVERGIC